MWNSDIGDELTSISSNVKIICSIWYLYDLILAKSETMHLIQLYIKSGDQWRHNSTGLSTKSSIANRCVSTQYNYVVLRMPMHEINLYYVSEHSTITLY